MKNVLRVRRMIGLAATAAALWLSTTTVAGAQVPGVTVTVFPDHYVLAGRYIDDLDKLEDVIAQMRPRGVQLDACGEGTSRALRAAAHRFRNHYLDLRTAGVDDAACRPASLPGAIPVMQRFGDRPLGIYDEAVDRWWSTLSMP